MSGFPYFYDSDSGDCDLCCTFEDAVLPIVPIMNPCVPPPILPPVPPAFPYIYGPLPPPIYGPVLPVPFVPFY